MDNTNEVNEIQVTRSASCQSLSERSTISYDIGTIGDSQYIRLSGNSAGGLFCKEWVSMADIQKLLEGKTSVTSKTLQPVYAGKSANSPGFLLAALISEKMATGKDTTTKDSIPTEKLPATPPQKKPAKNKQPS
jgi:hypothetical protein